ncbi:uncharacterized protein F5147DRAFT_647171 [Suillus discolor]|uniref:Uncharacterized protein n=1 Tax=Suillus discolor TaxID=1912936 RepID=A0A9P7FM20_9AGAM|nr:uncharacterized protein F5147DRAFT_647171 [Suillus discolor]KAG2120729.1 hypothetical protein F5147DRAFT_647171 [Suillus discolor]
MSRGVLLLEGNRHAGFYFVRSRSQLEARTIRDPMSPIAMMNCGHMQWQPEIGVPRLETNDRMKQWQSQASDSMIDDALWYRSRRRCLWRLDFFQTARTFSCEVDTLTLSKEQKALAEECIKLRLHYHFKLADFALKSSNAAAVVSASIFPESRYSGYHATALITANTGSKGHFMLEGVENCAAYLIIENYPSLEDKADFDTFQCKWQYLFAYAGAGFAKGYHGMLTFTRPNDCPATCD